MNPKKFTTKSERMRAYAEKQKKKQATRRRSVVADGVRSPGRKQRCQQGERVPTPATLCPSSAASPITVGFEALCGTYGGKARE